MAAILLMLFAGCGVGPSSPCSPLIPLFQSTEIQTVQIENKHLGDAVREVVQQVEAKHHKKIQVLFSPEKLTEQLPFPGSIRGNPPIEGNADHALYLLASDYTFEMSYIDDHVILIYDLGFKLRTYAPPGANF